jgi:hypothetical protein
MSIFKEKLMTEEVQKQEAVQPEAAPQQPPADLNISDLVALKSIIELLSASNNVKIIIKKQKSS